MFAGVKFQSDNTVSVVPISHIKNLKFPVENKSYQVFWSSDPDEEPNSSHKNVDKIYKTQSNKKDLKGSLPPSGYFYAKILGTAATFEEAEEILNALGLPLQKRITEKISKASSVKLISSAASSVVRAGMLENSLKFTDDDDDDDTDADETVEPVKQYKDRVKCLESENSKLEELVRNLKAKLISAKQELKTAKDETISVSEKLFKTKEKYKDVKEEFKKARQLNYRLQEKLIDSISVTVSPTTNEQHSIGEDETSQSLISSYLPTAFPDDINTKRKIVDDIDNCQPLVKKPFVDISNQALIDETLLMIPETSEITTDCTTSEDGNFILSDFVIKSSSMGCRSGQDGDKVFVKNLAVNLFGKNVLMNSSATGRKPPTGGKPARPALPKAGISYIKSLLEKRVENEQNLKNDMTEDEKKKILDQRSSFIIVNQAVGDKIASLRRAN